MAQNSAELTYGQFYDMFFMSATTATTCTTTTTSDILKAQMMLFLSEPDSCIGYLESIQEVNGHESEGGGGTDSRYHID